MTNKEYQDQVEQRFGKPLKDIMRELIVEKGMDHWDGAAELGVPKETFKAWRSKFRLGSMQRGADLAVERRDKDLQEYQNQLKNVNFDREFIYQDECSLRGCKELLSRMLELKKQRRVLNKDNDAMSDMAAQLNIAMLEQAIVYIEQYEESKLYDRYEHELIDLKWMMENKL